MVVDSLIFEYWIRYHTVRCSIEGCGREVTQTWHNITQICHNFNSTLFPRYVKRSSLYKRLEVALADKYTHQPLQHVLDEPIIQLGPGGLVITVERHLKWIGWGMGLAMALNLFSSTKFMVKVIGGLIVSFCAAIKGITWILMNWK